MLRPPPLPKPNIPPLPRVPPAYGSPEWAAAMHRVANQYATKGRRKTPPAIPAGSGKGTPPDTGKPVMTPPQAGQIQPTSQPTKAAPASTDRQVGFSDRPMWCAQYGQPARRGKVTGDHRTHNGQGRLMYSFEFDDGSPAQMVYASEVWLTEADANKAGFV